MTSFITDRSFGIVTGVVVAALVFPPLIAVLVAGAGAGFAPLRHPDIVLNTLAFGVCTTICALLIGGGLAVALAGDVPARGTLERFIVMPLYLTPLLTAMGWNWLASPHSGLLNLILHAAFGAHVTLNAVSPAGVVFVSALATAPLPFLLTSDALRAMDASLTEAARVHGASPGGVFRRIVLPLLAPATLAAAVLVFVQSVGMFSVPAVLGLPSGFTVATTQIYQLLESYPPRIAEATAWGVLLLAITALVTFAQARFLSERSYATITGRAFRPAQHGSGLRSLRAALAWLYVLLSTLLPLVALLWAASSAFVTVEPKLMHFTPAHFAYVLLAYPKTWLAATNSAILGVLAATCVCAIGFAVSWFVLRGRGRARGLLDQMSMVPLSMPAMVFALGLLWVYVGLPLPIYGTLGILLLAYVTHYLPFGVRSTSAALRQLHPELEEASRVAGQDWLGTVRRVTFPLIKPALVATWVLLFVMAMQEVSASILLYTSHSIVLSVAVFDLWENGNPSNVAALGFVQLVVSFAIVGLALRARERAAIA